MSELSVTTRTGPNGPVVELAGELDHDTASEVRSLLSGLELRPGTQLVVDLTDLTFCDSSGITVLLAARNHVLAAQAAMALSAVPDGVQRVFRILGLDQVFVTYPTVEEAVAAWPQQTE
ncbi:MULTISPECIES: STAS domain-containing protein [unclassified Streptomyces]|uniref:STAS domain-containing protein n=1 Tax=unclassified Streptomyces TaxID=2593676 RepID=UPI002E2A580F|nr:STAS domain-containing protein [Streptomyces sp. NBC_00306]